jgi:hypothetical protein
MLFWIYIITFPATVDVAAGRGKLVELILRKLRDFRTWDKDIYCYLQART